jgi:hypothetical protein
MSYLAGCGASQHLNPTILIARVFAATAIDFIYLQLSMISPKAERVDVTINIQPCLVKMV